MRLPSAPPDHERHPVRPSDLVTRLAVVLAVASAMTFAATAILGLDSEWMVVALGESLLALTLLTQI
jgi:hypothetical protein